MQNDLCTICLSAPGSLKNISDADAVSLNIIAKLQKCVPEVDWKTNIKLCNLCLQQLENVCAFRELCIKSYLVHQRGSEDIKCESGDLVAPNFSEEVKEEFICFHCKKGCRHKTELTKHIKSEHGKKKELLNCENCNNLFASKKLLEKHKLKCEKKDSDDEEVKDEIINELTNICATCGATFGNKYLLKRHIKNVHATEKRFKCELCDRRFASPVYLNAHKRYHIGERKHICSFCGKGYITASDLYHHEKIHANKRAYRCEICPKAFNTSSDLHKHKICVHLDRAKWKYECSYCQRRFPLKTNLDTHTKTHTGERNFLCHLCDRKCINKSVLKRHIESHSTVKLFKCSVCLQGYKYQKSLDIHMVKVHGIGDAKLPERVKRHSCSICAKSYFANNKLQKHMRSHTGERPFKCPACEKCFIDKSYVKQHLKVAHNVIN